MSGGEANASFLLPRWHRTSQHIWSCRQCFLCVFWPEALWYRTHCPLQPAAREEQQHDGSSGPPASMWRFYISQRLTAGKTGFRSPCHSGASAAPRETHGTLRFEAFARYLDIFSPHPKRKKCTAINWEKHEEKLQLAKIYKRFSGNINWGKTS